VDRGRHPSGLRASRPRLEADDDDHADDDDDEEDYEDEEPHAPDVLDELLERQAALERQLGIDNAPPADDGRTADEKALIIDTCSPESRVTIAQVPLPEPFDQLLELEVEHGVACLQVGDTGLEPDVLRAALLVEQPRKLDKARLEVVEDDHWRSLE
jgi:hypothetical protein